MKASEKYLQKNRYKSYFHPTLANQPFGRTMKVKGRLKKKRRKFIYDDSEKHLTVAYLHRMIYDLSHILSWNFLRVSLPFGSTSLMPSHRHRQLEQRAIIKNLFFACHDASFCSAFLLSIPRGWMWQYILIIQIEIERKSFGRKFFIRERLNVSRNQLHQLSMSRIVFIMLY